MAGGVGAGSLPQSFAGVVEVLRCPACRQRLLLAHATLSCPLGHSYEVTGGIPRFVVDSKTTGNHLMDMTAQAFGKQWTELGDVAGVALDDLNLHLPLSWSLSETFRGVVLDAGCGMGRYAALATELGATALGLDLSRAVDKAVQLWPNVAFIQADLCSPPLADRAFDLVYSFGVLHHLLDPKAGFQKCFDLVKPGGLLLVWVYSEHGGVLRNVRKIMRSFTGRFPSAVRPVAATAAAAIWWGYVWPNKRLSRGGSLRFYLDKGFSQLFVDCHDALVAPLETYLRVDDCREWLGSIDSADSGLEQRRDGSGWIIWARRAS